MGIAIRSRITLNVSFPSIFWKTVVREELSVSDIQSFDEAAYNFIAHIQKLNNELLRLTKLTNNEIDIDIDLDADSDVVLDPEQELVKKRMEMSMLLQDITWTCNLSNGDVTELIPDGRNIVVAINKVDEFLQKYVAARMTENFKSMEAFREGFLDVIPSAAIQLLRWSELEYLVCGSRVIDVKRLQENTEYDDDVSPHETHIRHFWNVLKSFTEAEKSSFLKFVWARSTLPPVGFDFPQKMKIQSAVGEDAAINPDLYLPKAHTCFFSINLPRYSSEQLMAKKLRYAMQNCGEMDADFRMTEADIQGWWAPVT